LLFKVERLEKTDNPLLIMVPTKFVLALLKLHEKLDDKDLEWAVGGDLGEALRTVRIEPDCIEILTSKEGAQKIRQAIADYSPRQIELLVQQLPRNASIQDNEYPVYLRSHYFEFYVNEIKVKVHGALQYKINGWDWGDVFQFKPDQVYVVEKKTDVVPLSDKYSLYTNLGWFDRAEKIRRIFAIRKKS